MKLLLTSGGLQNDAIISALRELTGKPFEELNLVFIPTAANAEEGDKRWLIKDLEMCNKLGFKEIDIVDISAPPSGFWEERLEKADIVFVEGGNTFYLLKYMKERGFDVVLKKLLEKEVVYVGVSAGSYVACPTIEVATWKHQDRNRVGLEDLSALNLVPFLLSVHYKPEYKDILKAGIAGTKYPVRILNDEQAILINDSEFRLVGDQEEIKI